MRGLLSQTAASDRAYSQEGHGKIQSARVQNKNCNLTAVSVNERILVLLTEDLNAGVDQP